MERHEVASTAEVTASRVKLVTVRGVRIGLFRVGDSFRAYRDFCPHAGAPLCKGPVHGTTLRCPWHGWEFNLDTGAHVTHPSCRLDAFEVQVEGDKLYVLA